MFAEFLLSLAAVGWAATASATAAVLDRRLHTDELTGLGNRAALQRRARRTCSGLVGVLLIDLDQFKTINDSHGHDFGNKVLAALGARFAAVCAPGEQPVRLHGDEFAVHLGRIPDRSHAQRRADEVTAALAEPLHVADQRLTALGSVGFATATASTPLGDLLGAADRHMYRSKHARRRPPALRTARPRRVRDLPPPDHAA